MITILKGVMVELNCRTGCGEGNQAGRHFDGTDGESVGSRNKMTAEMSALT